MFVERVIQRLEDIVNSFPQKTIVGVGDLMLDQYRRGKAVVLSPEAPVPDLYNFVLQEYPGAAANVAWNVGLLGGHVYLVGVLGKDAEAEGLRKLLSENKKIKLIGIEDGSRPTTTKLNYCNNQFHVLRESKESKVSIDTSVFNECKAEIQNLLSQTDAIFVQDHDKGVVRESLINFLVDLRRSYPELIIALDPKKSNERSYRAGMCSIMKPNWSEACHFTKSDPANSEPESVAKKLGEKYECDTIVTLGGEGLVFYEHATDITGSMPGERSEGFDTAGAGDTVLAGAVLALSSGATLAEAALIGNTIGGIGVRKEGTCFVTHEELLVKLAGMNKQACFQSVQGVTQGCYDVDSRSSGNG